MSQHIYHGVPCVDTASQQGNSLGIVTRTGTRLSNYEFKAAKEIAKAGPDGVPMHTVDAGMVSRLDGAGIGLVVRGRQVVIDTPIAPAAYISPVPKEDIIPQPSRWR